MHPLYYFVRGSSGQSGAFGSSFPIPYESVYTLILQRPPHHAGMIMLWKFLYPESLCSVRQPLAKARTTNFFAIRWSGLNTIVQYQFRKGSSVLECLEIFFQQPTFPLLTVDSASPGWRADLGLYRGVEIIFFFFFRGSWRANKLTTFPNSIINGKPTAERMY